MLRGRRTQPRRAMQQRCPERSRSRARHSRDGAAVPRAASGRAVPPPPPGATADTPGVQRLNCAAPSLQPPQCHQHVVVVPLCQFWPLDLLGSQRLSSFTCARWVSHTSMAFSKSWMLFLQWVHTCTLNRNSLGLSELQTSLRHGSMIKFSGPV